MSTGTESTEERSIADLLLALDEDAGSAWEELLRRYGGLVVATVQSFRLPHADIHDAVQTTWLRLLENHHRIRSPERLAGWLVTTARRECIRTLRETKRQATTEMIDDNAVDPSVGPEQQVVEQVTGAITATTLRTLISELTPRQQTVLRALFTDHPGHYTDIARITGLPLGSIGPTRNRALAQLRTQLHKHGFDSSNLPGQDSTRRPRPGRQQRRRGAPGR